MKPIYNKLAWDTDASDPKAQSWVKHIDWMALNGINLPLAFVGQEYAHQTCIPWATATLGVYDVRTLGVTGTEGRNLQGQTPPRSPREPEPRAVDKGFFIIAA